MRTTFRTRLTLMNILVLGLMLLLSGFLLRWQTSSLLKKELDASLLALAETEMASSTDSPDGSVHLHPIVPASDDPSRINKSVLLVDATGRVLLRSSIDESFDISIPSEFLDDAERRGMAFRTVESPERGRVRIVGLPIGSSDLPGAVLVVATSLKAVEGFLGTLDMVLAAVFLVGLGASGAAGYFLARRSLRPIARMNFQAEAIGSTSIEARLDEPASNDELAELTRVLNRMLDRLQEGFEAQRRFTSDASHEIRTPLSILQGEIEVCLRKPRAPEEYRAALSSSLEEVKRLTSMVEGLLTLARVDGAPSPPGETTVDFSEIVRDEIGRIMKEARRRGLRMSSQICGTLSLKGDAALLSRLVANLLDNAVKYSRKGDQIVVRLEPRNSSAALIVEDTGPGMKPAERERALERFFRGAATRPLNPTGAGLGLPICRYIAQLHGGTIELDSSRGIGTKVEITLPS